MQKRAFTQFALRLIIIHIAGCTLVCTLHVTDACTYTHEHRHYIINHIIYNTPIYIMHACHTHTHNITELATLQPCIVSPAHAVYHCMPIVSLYTATLVYIAAIICFPDILSPSLISFSVHVHILSCPSLLLHIQNDKCMITTPPSGSYQLPSNSHYKFSYINLYKIIICT